MNANTSLPFCRFTIVRMTEKFSVPVLFTELDHELKGKWIAYEEPSIKILPKGWVKDEGRRPLSADMVWEKDVRITLRDGVNLLADIFRPVSSDQEPVPAIMPWSPYGKTGTGIAHPKADLGTSLIFYRKANIGQLSIQGRRATRKHQRSREMGSP